MPAKRKVNPVCQVQAREEDKCNKLVSGSKEGCNRVIKGESSNRNKKGNDALQQKLKDVKGSSRSDCEGGSKGKDDNSSDSNSDSIIGHKNSKGIVWRSVAATHLWGQVSEVLHRPAGSNCCIR